MDYSLKKTNSTTFYCNISKNMIFEEAYVFYNSAANTDSKLMQKYIECNFQACQLIKSSLILQAIQILVSTVQQLQFSVKNGKSMNEMVIIALLNNLSHAYYQNEDYNKAIQAIRSLTYTISNINNRLSGDYSKWSKNIQLFLHFNLAKYYTYNLFISLQSKQVKPQFANVAVVRIQQSFQRFSHCLKDSDIQLSLINIKLSSSLLEELSSFLKLKEELTTDEIMQMLLIEIGKLKKLPFDEKLCFRMRKYNCESLGKIRLLGLKIEEKGVKSKILSKEIFEGGLMEFPFALFLIGKHHFFSSEKKSRSIQINSIAKARKYLLWSLYFAAKLCYFISPLHKQIFQFYDTKVNTLKDQSQSKKVINSINPPILMKSNNTSWKDIKVQFLRVSNEPDIEKLKTPRKKDKKSIDKWTKSSEEQKNKFKKQSFRVSLGKCSGQKLLGLYKNMVQNKKKESPKKSFDQRQKNKRGEDKKRKKQILITQKNPETKKRSEKARTITSKSMSVSTNSWKLLAKNTRVTNDFTKHNFMEQYFPKREIDSFQKQKISTDFRDEVSHIEKEYTSEQARGKGKRMGQGPKLSRALYSLKRL